MLHLLNMKNEDHEYDIELNFLWITLHHIYFVGYAPFTARVGKYEMSFIEKYENKLELWSTQGLEYNTITNHFEVGKHFIFSLAINKMTIPKMLVYLFFNFPRIDKLFVE